jgi:hypothetical protein
MSLFFLLIFYMTIFFQSGLGFQWGTPIFAVLLKTLGDEKDVPTFVTEEKK